MVLYAYVDNTTDIWQYQKERDNKNDNEIDQREEHPFTSFDKLDG